MSEMEHNKGRLIPSGIDTSDMSEEVFEEYEEHGFVQIDGELYKVEWEIRRGELYDFAYVNEDTNGVIEFNTWHYNGGGHWTEVVERELNK